MRRSIKVALILGTLAIIYLILPFVFGLLTQRYTLNFVEKENNTLGKVMGLHIELAQYNRGWFTSTALLQIEKKTVDGSYSIAKSIPIIIKHGPTYFARGQFSAGVGLIKSTHVSLSDSSPYQIDFYDNVGFRGERGTVVLLSNEAAQMPNFNVDSLVMKIKSDLNANHFNFDLVGKGLRLQDPQHSVSLTIKNFQSNLVAHYISDRHWQLTFSLGLQKDQLSTLVPGPTPAPLTLNADQINLERVHLDTKKMANILTDLIQLKQDSDAQKPIKPMAWAALVQKLLTEMIASDTSMSVAGFSIATPMGQFDAGYTVSFPTLPDAHDYFDLATRNVGALHIAIPHWIFTNPQSATQFALSNFTYNVFSNTVFSRHSAMTLGEFDISSPQSTVKTPTFYANGFSYEGDVFGDSSSLSQTMAWKLARVCTTNGCFKQVDSQMKLLNLNFEAFRGVAAATQQLVQYDSSQQTTPMATQWMSLVNAYMKLITPASQLILTNDMMTPQGALSVHAQVSWPDLKANAAPTTTDFINQTQYQLHVLFPTAYADALLGDASAAELALKNPTDSVTASSETKKLPFEIQVAQFLQYAISQGYLKKEGNGYLLDLAGKGNAFTVNGKVWQSP